MAWFEILESMPALFAALAGLFSLLVGSFLNVVIHRLPVMLEREWRRNCREVLAEGGALSPVADDPPAEPYNLVVPRSHCPGCGHRITARENIPLVSYLWLRGRCAQCAQPISLRYPAVELLTAVLSALVAWRFGLGVAALGAIVLTWGLVALTFIDLDHQLLPDNITLPFLWLGLGLNLFDTYTELPAAVIGAIAGYGLLWLVYHGFRLLTGKEGMGYGDFKLTGMLGAWLGWGALPGIILLSSLVGAVVGVLMITLHGRSRSKPIPFGPFLAAAGWIYLMWGEGIEAAYFAMYAS
jgi:leader peptidase (prepilin peptidase) / N-methyltransferase